MKFKTLFLMTLSAALVVGAQLSGCNNNNPPAPAPTQAPGVGQSLFNKYGGAATITKVVDDAVTGLVADCKENPYFTTVLDMPGHDSTDRLKSCLDLFFTNALGGPATYPGPSHFRNAPPEGYPCDDMTTAHKDLGIPSDVFDQFVTDLGSVLKSNGVTDADTTTVATALVGLKSQVIANPPSNPEIVYDYAPPQGGCTTVTPAPSPSPSPSTSPAAVMVNIPLNADTLGTAAYGTNPLMIAAGTTVTWMNGDVDAHTSTSDTGVWDSGNILPGKSFEFMFMNPGTYHYHCTIHGAAKMSGVIVVQ